MADIDMIPRSYRDGVRVRRTARLVTIALAVIVTSAAAGHAALRWRTVAIDRKADALRTAAAQYQSSQARDAAFRETREKRLRAEAALRGVRRQGELAAFAQALDAALPQDVWLTGMQLRRDAAAMQAGGAAGFGAAQDGKAAAPMHGASLVELSGQAASYQAVTGFLSRLGRADGVSAVQLQSSGAGSAAPAIDFRAAVVLAQGVAR